jgi:hypothetical protein
MDLNNFVVTLLLLPPYQHHVLHVRRTIHTPLSHPPPHHVPIDPHRDRRRRVADLSRGKEERGRREPRLAVQPLAIDLLVPYRLLFAQRYPPMDGGESSPGNVPSPSGHPATPGRHPEPLARTHPTTQRTTRTVPPLLNDTRRDHLPHLGSRVVLRPRPAHAEQALRGVGTCVPFPGFGDLVGGGQEGGQERAEGRSGVTDVDRPNGRPGFQGVGEEGVGDGGDGRGADGEAGDGRAQVMGGFACREGAARGWIRAVWTDGGGGEGVPTA